VNECIVLDAFIESGWATRKSAFRTFSLGDASRWGIRRLAEWVRGGVERGLRRGHDLPLFVGWFVRRLKPTPPPASCGEADGAYAAWGLKLPTLVSCGLRRDDRLGFGGGAVPTRGRSDLSLSSDKNQASTISHCEYFVMTFKALADNRQELAASHERMGKDAAQKLAPAGKQVPFRD